MDRYLIASCVLLTVSLALLTPAFAAEEPVVSVNADTSREAKLETVRVVLLSSGYETVFTGDPDPKKAVIRRLNLTLLVDPLGKGPKGATLGIGPLEALVAGTETSIRTNPAGTQAFSSGAIVKRYARKERYALPKVADEERALVLEESHGPLVAEPERIDLRVKVEYRGKGGTCVFKAVRLK